MPTAIGSLLLASVLGLAAGSKLGDRAGSVVALDTYGLRGRPATALWTVLVIAEVVLAAGVAVGSRSAAWAAAALLAAFAAAQALVIARGGSGAPCACFGRRGQVSAASAARVLAAAGAAAAIAVWAETDGTSAGLAVAVVAALVALAAAVARRGRPDGALDIAGEGPEPGERLGEPADRPRLLVFGSSGCHLCAALWPALGGVAERHGAGLVHLDEDGDAAEWDRYRVPGSPYAVVLDRDGVVRTKGTVNDARQVESLLAGAGVPPVRGASRRAFLRRAAGVAAAAGAAPTISSLVRPGEADAYHFCGHIYTTDSCPHPTGLPRVDARGFPLRARDGHAVDDLGRLIDAQGRPIGDDGALLTDPDGRALAPASRTRVCTATGAQYGIPVRVDGSWYRCCGGSVRKLVDCCSTHRRRINGDRALRGYCYGKRKVFCVMYFQTRVPC